MTTIEPISVSKDRNPVIYSNKSNYKQTIEIEEPTGYTPVTNKILCNASRYTEVKIVDFLEAYVDPSVTLQPRIVTGKQIGRAHV